MHLGDPLERRPGSKEPPVALTRIIIMYYSIIVIIPLIIIIIILVSRARCGLSAGLRVEQSASLPPSQAPVQCRGLHETTRALPANSVSCARLGGQPVL